MPKKIDRWVHFEPCRGLPALHGPGADARWLHCRSSPGPFVRNQAFPVHFGSRAWMITTPFLWLPSSACWCSIKETSALTMRLRRRFHYFRYELQRRFLLTSSTRRGRRREQPECCLNLGHCTIKSHFTAQLILWNWITNQCGYPSPSMILVNNSSVSQYNSTRATSSSPKFWKKNTFQTPAAINLKIKLNQRALI